MRSKIIFSILSILMFVPAMACDTCQAQQPKFMQNITHGVGPQNQMDYIISIIGAIIVILTLVLSVIYLVKPGEKNPDHVKNIVIDQTLK